LHSNSNSHTHSHPNLPDSRQAHIHFAVVAQMVEHQLPKLRVVGSIPIYRSLSIALFFFKKAR
jgi:hypothetical protein